MENSLSPEDLIPNKRYWLDGCKDVSGVFVGITETGRPLFKEIEPKDSGYLVDHKGEMTLGGLFYEIENN